MNPKIYVRCLASYNNGILHGKWIECKGGEEYILDEIKAILATSPEPNAEEWAVHDYEDFGEIKLTEYPSIEKCANLAELIVEHGEAFTHWYAKNYGTSGGEIDLKTLQRDFEDSFCGTYSSAEDFVEQTYRECNDKIPDGLDYYIDWSAMARDWELSGDYYFVKQCYDETLVFRNN